MIRHLRPFTFLLPLLLLAGPLQAQRQERQEGPTNLQVYVVFDDNRPAGEQLRVDLTNAGGIPISQGFTDSSGRTVLQASGAGGYILKISGSSIQKDASESVEVFSCPATQCSRTIFVRVKAKVEAASGGSQSTGKQSGGTQRNATSGNPAVTSAAELRVPPTARKAFDQGMTAWQKRDYPQAAEKFEKAVADYPQYETAYNNLGVMYAHLGQTDKAMAAFKRAVELNDKNADADRNLARMLMRQKEYSQAVDLLKKALAVQAPDAATLTLLASAEIQNGNPDDALKDAQRVHALPHEGYSLVHYIAGEALEEKHQDSQASTEYALYLKEAPNGPEAAQVKSALARLSTPPALVAPNTQ